MLGSMPNDFHEEYPLCDTCMDIAGNELSAKHLEDTPRYSLDMVCLIAAMIGTTFLLLIWWMDFYA